jgi:membrane-bound serine protease (ClpP class)
VDRNAISAGSLISLAADSLYMATGGSIGAATAVDLEGRKASEKVISYFRAQMRATAEATGRRPDIAEAMVDETIEIPGISEKGKLLTLTYSEALPLGISDGTVDSIPEVLALMGEAGAEIVMVTPTWAEQVVRFLTDPIVSSLLMSIGFLGLLIEIKTPGFGLGGIIALVALFLFFGSHFFVQLAGWEELILFAAGTILLGLEVFAFPGFGFLGVAGIGCILASLFLSLVGRLPQLADLSRAAYILCGAILVTVLGGVLLFRFLPRTPLFGWIALDAALRPGEGYAPGKTPNIMGMHGIAITPLHPTGKAAIGDTRYDVVTEGEYLDQDTPLVVTEVHGARVVVRRAPVDPGIQEES